MPKSPRIPSYRYHKASKQAVVVLNRKSYYLGSWNSPESQTEYRRVIAEHWTPEPGPKPANPGDSPPLVKEVMVAYWNRRVVTHYVKDGKPTSEQDNIRQALRFLKNLYAETPIRDFRPLALKAVRRSMIEAGRCRKLINRDIYRIRGMFRWAASEELYGGDALAALNSVEALAKGRSDAKDRPPIQPVDESIVLATLPHLSPTLAAMVRIQLLTACRPGEVCAIRPMDLERVGEAWRYRPGSHKTEHHGRERVIVIGPKAREVLTPWLDRDPAAYCFSPAEVVAKREAKRKATTRRKRGRPASRPMPGGHYTKDSYRVAVARACDRAFLHPTLAIIKRKDLTVDQRAELNAWRKAHRWHPHRLRHTKATEIRKAFDTESAAAVLGHSKPETTLIYAERDLSRAHEVMNSIG